MTPMRTARPRALGSAKLLALMLAGCLLALVVMAVGAASGWNIAKIAGTKATSKKADEKKDEPAGTGLLPASYDTLFQDWPTDPKPELVLLVTGAMRGHLRPCGCSEGQTGGLARRAGVFKFLKDELKLETVALDAGDLVDPTDLKKSAHTALPREKAALAAMAKLGYRAIGTGARDLRLDPIKLMGLLDADAKMKRIAGNVELKDKDTQSIFDELIKQGETLEVRGKKVFVGHLLGEDAGDFGYGKPGDPVKAAKALAKKGEGAALRVLLTNTAKAKAVELAKAAPEWDVIVAESTGDPHSTDAELVGRTLVTACGVQGKHVAAIGWFPKEKLRLRFAVIEVNQRFIEDPAIETYYNDFVREMKEGDYLAKSSKLPALNGDSYVGAETCGKCHVKAYAKWKDSKHAHAFESLIKDKAKFQTHNPDCVGCHTTGFGYKSGFDAPEKSIHLLGNQCENCHGPGKRHSDAPADPQLRVQMRRSFGDIKSTCILCHDGDNSPKFKFEEYWPKVAHPWKN
jgi:hypothetical protein